MRNSTLCLVLVNSIPLLLYSLRSSNSLVIIQPCTVWQSAQYNSNRHLTRRYRSGADTRLVRPDTVVLKLVLRCSLLLAVNTPISPDIIVPDFAASVDSTS